jgi:hypothetical protein
LLSINVINALTSVPHVQAQMSALPASTLSP